jgi:hypothetical protein
MLTFVATESARAVRGCSAFLTMHGVPVLLARESSIVRAALEALPRLESIPIKSDSYLINKEKLVPGRGLEPPGILQEIQPLTKWHISLTRWITR